MLDPRRTILFAFCARGARLFPIRLLLPVDRPLMATWAPHQHSPHRRTPPHYPAVHPLSHLRPSRLLPQLAGVSRFPSPIIHLLPPMQALAAPFLPALPNPLLCSSIPGDRLRPKSNHRGDKRSPDPKMSHFHLPDLVLRSRFPIPPHRENSSLRCVSVLLLRMSAQLSRETHKTRPSHPVLRRNLPHPLSSHLAPSLSAQNLSAPSRHPRRLPRWLLQ
jgi:hypothetical protein